MCLGRTQDYSILHPYLCYISFLTIALRILLNFLFFSFCATLGGNEINTFWVT